VCSVCRDQLALDVAGAFPTLVTHHQDLVYGIARRSVRERADAEDLAQEAFLRAFRALRTYEPSRIQALHLRGWLARITLNLARNRARDRSPETADVTAIREPADDRAPSPERVAQGRESAAMWRRLLDDLPPAYRRAVELRHVDGLAYPELAEALGKPLGTVKSDVHRGIRLLRRAYEVETAKDEPAMGTTSADGRGRLGGAAMLPTPEVMIR
jgi:RNA polymerase sigma factor (sigma-70 family)